MNEIIKAKIDLLSRKPGVYLMKNKDDKIIYVGKAKVLINRVKQYFTRPQSGKVFKMVMEAYDFDTIETETEKEALLLEVNLIRKYYPKYNILLKDGKFYPYIALKNNGDPYLKISYNDKDKSFKYFGPFPNSGAAYKTIDLLNKIYPLRKCRNVPNSPCLYYHLGECLGPCVKKVSQKEYEPLVEDIKKILNGDIADIKNKYKEKMNEAAANLEFEKADEFKKIIVSLDYVAQRQGIMVKDHIDRDVLGISVRDGYFSLAILTYRRGILLGKNIFVLEIFENIDEQLISIIFQYYQNHQPPKEIILGNQDVVNRLNETKICNFICPVRGLKKDLLLLAIENAKQGLDEHFLTARLEDDTLSLLERLGKLLNINTPLNIELFDNSHLQGSEPIGAMVSFINGEKAPSRYRKFNIRESDGKDDLKSMYEIITRRYKRLKEENLSYPDLILVDGGLNQINVAETALSNIDVTIPVAGLAKDDHHHTDGLLYNGELIPIEHKDKLFLMLIRMQDEVHRYAISFHRYKREKILTHSFLDDIPGIGKKRKEVLLKTYPSLDALKKATFEELNQILPSNISKMILEHLQQ